MRLGGAGVVLAVAFLAAFLIREALPLAARPEIHDDRARVAPLGGDGLLFGVDPFVEAGWRLTEEGVLVLRDLRDGATLAEERPFDLAEGERLVAARRSPSGGVVAAATSAGRVALAEFRVVPEYGEDLARTYRFSETKVRWLRDEADGARVAHLDGDVEDDRLWLAYAVADEPRVHLVRGRLKTNRLTGAERLSVKALVADLPAPAADLALLDHGGLVVGLADGAVLGFKPDRRFRTLDAMPTTAASGLEPGVGGVLAVRSLIGRGSVLVVRAGDVLEHHLPRPREDATLELYLAHVWEAPVRGLRDVAVSPRQRVFFALGEDELRVGQSTAGRLYGRSPLAPGWRGVLLAPREDALAVWQGDGAVRLEPVELHYPGFTWETWFTKIQYEGLPHPDYVWQSTGGTESYEPKVSLVPLVVGTLKGALWALLPSIPIALLGALYCARFLRGRARESVKSFVELLAGIPSVVLGFLGALYLAPKMNDRYLSVLLLPLVLALTALLCGALWARLPIQWRRRFHGGRAAWLLAPVFLLLADYVLRSGPGLEEWVFGEPLTAWLRDRFEVPFEQRNALVVGLAMGFAVTPLVFTLAEDAFRNVPRDLSEASLALGATEWQTAVRVVVPPALPGVVAASMIGLGRAVGETMIVLMATGNTPITSWNPFRGFRTLSANLAVELPEAEKGAGLYRTLFLSALLLFAMTFVVNLAAEWVRVRGRKKL